MGPVQGPMAPAEAVAVLFTRANLPCRAVADPWTPVWTKLAVNCAINPITALTGILNGPVAESDPAERLVRDVTVEVLAVARASGVDPGSAETVADRVLAVARATAGNRSSMGQDVDRGDTHRDRLHQRRSDPRGGSVGRAHSREPGVDPVGEDPRKRPQAQYGPRQLKKEVVTAFPLWTP